MKRKFITPVSMRVPDYTVFLRYLLPELEVLGYSLDLKNNFSEDNSLLVNNLAGVMGDVDFIYDGQFSSYTNTRIHLKEYNAELYLALAAMSDGDNFHPGEYLVFLPDVDSRYVTKIWHRDLTLLKFRYYDSENSVRVHEIPDGANHPKMFRKATSKEILAFFNNKSSINKTIKIMEKKTISREELIRMIDAACVSWKSTLIERYAADVFIKGNADVSFEQYTEMKSASDGVQLKLLKEIFGDWQIYDENMLYKCNYNGEWKYRTYKNGYFYDGSNSTGRSSNYSEIIPFHKLS